jgi:hypothetical protein
MTFQHMLILNTTVDKMHYIVHFFEELDESREIVGVFSTPEQVINLLKMLPPRACKEVQTEDGVKTICTRLANGESLDLEEKIFRHKIFIEITPTTIDELSRGAKMLIENQHHMDSMQRIGAIFSLL